MPNSLTGRNFDLTDNVRGYIEKKVDRLRKVFGNIQKIDVILSAGKLRSEADLVVTATLGTLKCAARAETPLAAFDVAMDKMERQLARHKARVVGNKKHPRGKARRRAMDAQAEAAAEGLLDAPDETAEDEEDLPNSRPIRPRRMSLAEAVDAFVRSDYELLVFLEESSEHVQILFRDDDGHNQILEVVGEK
jgi:putative sigma-54 modulation protein